MAKDKSHGLYGWIIEFFVAFFDLMGHEILEAVEESRIKGMVFRSLELNIYTLIPKGDKISSFNEFRPISLCNVIYKII